MNEPQEQNSQKIKNEELFFFIQIASWGLKIMVRECNKSIHSNTQGRGISQKILAPYVKKLKIFYLE